MAVDKKGDYYNPPSAYTDLDGNLKTFTYIDHDRHTSYVDSMARETEETRKAREQELIILNKSISEEREKSINAILSLPAISFLQSRNTFAEDCIIRDQEKGIIWDENFIRGFLLTRPDMIHTILNSTWKNTVKEQYWFEEMSYEDIIEGKWKELM